MEDSMERYSGEDEFESESDILTESDVEDGDRAMEELAQLTADAATGLIEPYRFEPQYGEGEAPGQAQEKRAEADLENRLGNNNW